MIGFTQITPAQRYKLHHPTPFLGRIAYTRLSRVEFVLLYATVAGGYNEQGLREWREKKSRKLRVYHFARFYSLLEV
jgi:hypothetical protein